jgi:hypothetical protein
MALCGTRSHENGVPGGWDQAEGAPDSRGFRDIFRGSPWQNGQGAKRSQVFLPAPNEAIGKLGNAPNEANSGGAERSQAHGEFVVVGLPDLS